MASSVNSVEWPKRTVMLTLHLSNDVEASQFDIGLTSIRLVRVGNVIQIVFSSSREARFLYKDLAERHKRDKEALKDE